MKRLLTAFLSIIMLLPLCACGSKEPSPYELVTDTTPKIELISQNTQVFVSKYGFPCVTYAAEIKNTGRVNVRLYDLSIDLADSDGNIMKSENYITAAPSVIAPGESSFVYEILYVGISSEGIESIDSIGEASLNLHYAEGKSHSAETLDDIEFSEVKMIPDGAEIKLIGKATNISDDDYSSSINVCGVIRDENGLFQNLIVADVDNLLAGETRGFEDKTNYANPTVDYSAATIDLFAVTRGF